MKEQRNYIHVLQILNELWLLLFRLTASSVLELELFNFILLTEQISNSFN